MSCYFLLILIYLDMEIYYFGLIVINKGELIILMFSKYFSNNEIECVSSSPFCNRKKLSTLRPSVVHHINIRYTI